jgi:hypothetical protein
MIRGAYYYLEKFFKGKWTIKFIVSRTILDFKIKRMEQKHLLNYFEIIMAIEKFYIII